MLNEDLTTSDEGLAMLTSFEGTVLHVYQDQAGVATVGTGHALTAQERAAGAFAGGISREQAKALLRADVSTAERAVKVLVKVPLEQHQFDALVSFTFNLGSGALASSTLLERLNAGNYGAVAFELPKWCKRRDPRTGQLVADAGLLHRREAEAAVWLNGYQHPDVEAAVAKAAAVQFQLLALLPDRPAIEPDEGCPATDRNC